jgi:glycerol-3-phosphate dehydrogenase
LVNQVADLIAPVLGWSAKEKKASISAYLEQVTNEEDALSALINS